MKIEDSDSPDDDFFNSLVFLFDDIVIIVGRSQMSTCFLRKPA